MHYRGMNNIELLGYWRDTSLSDCGRTKEEIYLVLKINTKNIFHFFYVTGRAVKSGLMN